MPERIRRRPLAWNALLAKGHVHQTSKSTARAAERAGVQADIDDYWDQSDNDVPDDEVSDDES